MLRQVIKAHDVEVMQNITNVSADSTDSPKTLSVKVTFKPNDFFTNTVLSVTLRYEDDSSEQVKSTEGTIINWNDGKNVTVKKIKKK